MQSDSRICCYARAVGPIGNWRRLNISPCAADLHPYNPHSPMNLMFEVKADGHVFGALLDAFFKSGAGGSAIYVVPSLHLAIYKMSASDAQLDPELTGLPVTYQVRHSRDNWKPGLHDQF